MVSKPERRWPMLPREGTLLPETLLAQEGVTVNDIFKFTGDLSDSYHRKLFSDILKSYQEYELKRFLGPRWQPRDQGVIVCPGLRFPNRIINYFILNMWNFQMNVNQCFLKPS